MPGMNSGINANDPTVVAAFRAALAHQGLIALAIFLLVALAWGSAKAWLPAGTGRSPATAHPAEPAGRRLLRIGFGVLWLFDGILQAQPAMAVGLPSKVIEPTAASSPGWVQHLVNWAGTSWSYHPIQAASATVWIQVGIGIWLLVAPSGWWSRAAGLASLGWGLVVWAFGESFGGIFAPGLTWMFGAPGAALFYSAAGALIALPAAAWRTPRLGRGILAAMGAFLAGMAVLQAWPGRGFWQGSAHGQRGTLAGMTASMAQTSQPHSISALVSSFTSFDQAHGAAVNLVVVLALALTGLALLTAWRRTLLPALVVLGVFCLADWVLVEDMGVFGGLGTDPNSMIPMALVVIGGYLALTRVPAPATEPATAQAGEPAAAPAGGTAPEPAAVPSPAGDTPPAPVPVPAAAGGWRAWRERLQPAALWRSAGTATVGSVASVGALGVVLLGAAPMAAAQANPNATTILAQSLAGSVAPMNYPAKGFQLTDQRGRRVTLASLHGKVILLTFLDPVCTSACPLIAQEFRAAGQMLGASDRHVELVAVVANPIFYQTSYTSAFTRQEGMGNVPNWLFLTGAMAQLRQVWKNYGIAAEVEPGGSMVGHTEVAFVIDRSGKIRQEFEDDPGPGTASTKASFAVMLANAARQYLGQS
jgi:cytochrome oxidase Cu insertion factor (SCO1/SenC/PrrC family)